MIKFGGYPFLEKEDYAFNVPGLSLLHGRTVKPLKLALSSSYESDEAGLAYPSGVWHDSGRGSAAEQHDSERIPHHHERRSPEAGRVYWAARSAICNR